MSARDAFASARRGLSRFLRRRGTTILALGLVAVALSMADLRGSIAVMKATGKSAVLVMLGTFVASIVVDACVFRFLARAVGRYVSIGRAVQARLGMDAVALAAPGGTLTGDVSAPFLLRAIAGIPLAEATSIVLLRKWGVLAGHTMLLAITVFVAGPFLGSASDALGGAFSARVALGATAVVFVVGAVLARELLRRGPAERLGRTIAKIPWEPARAFAAGRADALVRADASTSAFFDARDGRTLALVTVSFGRWLLESAEGFFVLTLLGASPRIGDVLALKALLSVLRTVIFFLPAGLGVRELGNVALISIVPGGTPEIAVAYTLLRRGLEVASALVWLLISGYTPWNARRRRPSAGSLRGAPPRGASRSRAASRRGARRCRGRRRELRRLRRSHGALRIGEEVRGLADHARIRGRGPGRGAR